MTVTATSAWSGWLESPMNRAAQTSCPEWGAKVNQGFVVAVVHVGTRKAQALLGQAEA